VVCLPVLLVVDPKRPPVAGCCCWGVPTVPVLLVVDPNRPPVAGCCCWDVPTCTAGGGSEQAACGWLLLLGCAEESAGWLRQSARGSLPASHVVLAPQLLQRLVLELLQLQQPQLVLRIRNRIQIWKGSGFESETGSKKICKKEPYLLRPK
jgi:hypothetical protein